MLARVARVVGWWQLTSLETPRSCSVCFSAFLLVLRTALVSSATAGAMKGLACDMDGLG